MVGNKVTQKYNLPLLKNKKTCYLQRRNRNFCIVKSVAVDMKEKKTNIFTLTFFLKACPTKEKKVL